VLSCDRHSQTSATAECAESEHYSTRPGLPERALPLVIMSPYVDPRTEIGVDGRPGGPSEGSQAVALARFGTPRKGWAGPGASVRSVTERIARVYRKGEQFRVVVDSLLQFDGDRIEGVEERTAQEIVDHLQRFFPKRARRIEDPTAELVISVDVAVEPSIPRSSGTRPRGLSEASGRLTAPARICPPGGRPGLP
jgi:hypothetical protein